MRFAPNDDETMVEDTLERVLKEAVARAPRRENAAPMPDPEALRRKLGELGLLGAWLPEAVGGGDGGPRLLMALARALGRHPSRTGYIGSCVLGAGLLARGGQAARALAARVAAGETTVAVACLEPRRRWSSAPTLVVEGGRLTGVKAHVAEGPGAEALIVSAPEAGGTSLWLAPSDAQGLRIEGYEGFDGGSLASVRLEGVRGERLVGPRDGAAALEDALCLAAFAMSAEILGACEAAFAQTLDYLRTRRQFGRPLASNQALQFRAADLHAEIELLRSMVLGAAATLDRGLSPRARADVAAAAALAAETGDLVGREAIHLHGAIGMTQELGIGRHLLRINALARWLGDALHHREIFLKAEAAA